MAHRIVTIFIFGDAILGGAAGYRCDNWLFSMPASAAEGVSAQLSSPAAR